METLIQAQTQMNEEFESLNVQIMRTRTNISKLQNVEQKLKNGQQTTLVSMQRLFTHVMDIVYNLEKF